MFLGYSTGSNLIKKTIVLSLVHQINTENMASEDQGLKKELVGLVEDVGKELSSVLDCCNKEGRILS